MTINQWQTVFVEAAKHKFPNEWTVEQRLLSIYRQLADVSQIFQFRKLREDVSIQTRVADILPDVFLLCDQLGVDLEKELGGQILDFWKK